MTGPRVLLTVKEAAHHVGVTRETIYQWRRRGLVEWVRTAGGGVRIVEESLWHVPGFPRAGRRKG